ncbi:MAG: ATP-binding cassette domain-containing protein [Flavobacteriaceae bacterium]|jgi:cell division transport system ATP-binding protein|nr:ATP-binding cassette domain-containing protein [Flavobacteriaceae bacterium]
MSSTVVDFNKAKIVQRDQVIFEAIDLKIAKGEFVYLIGKTGSGKSSLLKTLYGELPLNSGTGQVAGFNLLGLKERQIPDLRRKLGIVFQDFQLLNDRNIYENLRFVLKATGWTQEAQISQRIEEVLSRVGMNDQGRKLPYQMSGGEQQRIAIARALLNDPELIVADEPTGNLDPQTSMEVMTLLKDLNKNGRSILMATHDYALLLKHPSRTLKCEDGRVFEVVQKKPTT